VFKTECPVRVEYGGRSFGVLAYPECVNDYRRELFEQDARERGFRAALIIWLRKLIESWAVTEGGSPVPLNEETIGRLSPGARRAIFAAIVHESGQVRPKAQTDEERDEVLKMTIEIA